MRLTWVMRELCSIVFTRILAARLVSRTSVRSVTVRRAAALLCGGALLRGVALLRGAAILVAASVFVMPVFVAPVEARDGVTRQRIEGSVIKGSQEQPKVLYIVPWQLPKSPSLDVPPPESEIDGVLEPVERDFYRQSLYFRRHLKIGVLPDSQ